MTADEKTVNLFTTRVRQMMLEYDKCKSENAGLRDNVELLKQEVKSLEERLRQAEENCKTLKTARMLEVADNDLEETKAKVARMVRSINRCITLLSEK